MVEVLKVVGRRALNAAAIEAARALIDYLNERQHQPKG